jgi:hypothetical protein
MLPVEQKDEHEIKQNKLSKFPLSGSVMSLKKQTQKTKHTLSQEEK